MYSFSNYYKFQKHRIAELKKKLQVFHNICLKKNFVRQIGKTLYHNNYSFFKSDEANEEQKRHVICNDIN